MLLKRCYVQGFGKLQDFSYEFSEGLNIICTENGWGKSTFAAFLRAMFYGLPQAGSRTKLEEAERRKYRPWNGGVMGGFLVFEADGKEYKAERTFGKKEAEDTFRLIDLSTNLESGDFSAELGRELFGLDKEAYSRTTYLPQNKVSHGGMNDSIGNKLGRMAEGEEDGNYEQAYGRLDELRKKYVPDRQKEEKGYVAEVTRKLSEARAGLEACRRKEESAKPWREKEQKAMAEKKEAEAMLTVCREKLETAAGYEALAAKKRHYTELRSREENLRIQKESMHGLFAAGVPKPETLRSCRQAAEEAAVLAGELRSYRMDDREQQEYSALQKIFSAGIPKAKEQVKCAEKTRRVCMGLSAILLLAGLVLGMMAFVGKKEAAKETLPIEQETLQNDKSLSVNPVFLACGGCSLLLGLGLAVAGMQKKAKGKKKEADLEHYEVLAVRKKKLEDCIAKRDDLLGGCIQLLAGYGMETEDVSGSLRILENRTRDFLRIESEYAESVKKREQFEQETSPESFYGLVAPEISFRELQREEQELLVRIARAAEEEKDCHDRAEQFETEAEASAELEEVCKELADNLEAKKREHGWITETMKCLKTAKEQFSSRYLQGLTGAFDTYLSLLGEEAFVTGADGHYNGIHPDIDLNLQVTAYGEDKELGYFSTGMQDLVGLCMRFALVDALFREEQPFLILDDPFVNLDKKKTERAMGLLKETAKRYQILYLVCHESRT